MRSINVFMEGVPEDVDIGLLEKALLSHPMVVERPSHSCLDAGRFSTA